MLKLDAYSSNVPAKTIMRINGTSLYTNSCLWPIQPQSRSFKKSLLPGIYNSTQSPHHGRDDQLTKSLTEPTLHVRKYASFRSKSSSLLEPIVKETGLLRSNIIMAAGTYDKNKDICFTMKKGSKPSVLKQSIRSDDSTQPFRQLTVFLSERHSRMLSELGVDIPSVPPATPMPEKQPSCHFVPSLNDVRSQRDLKSRLKAMRSVERNKYRQELEEQASLAKATEKQLEIDRKKRQRQEIYALNKVMAELEQKNFEEYCKAHGLHIKTSSS